MKRKTLSSSSAEMISYSDDLLLEILILLPAKSLIRFKSVCKHWRSLISDASFRHLHTRRHQNPQTFFLRCIYKSKSKSKLKYFHFNPTSKNFVPYKLKLDGVTLLQSCKGLLLLKCGMSYEYQDYYVLNPTTGEYRNLLIPYFKTVGCLFLAFDPLKSPYYKVFCLNSDETEVYESETHQWHAHNARCSSLGSLSYPFEWVYSDLKWVYSDLNNSAYSISTEDRIVCFNTEKLVFGMPSLDANPPGLPYKITESFGHVHCISYNDAMNDYVVNEITEKNGQWSFQHLFDFDSKALNLGMPFLLGVIRGDMKEEQSLVFHIPGKIMAYRFHERTFEELLDLSTQRVCKLIDCYQFVESLTPV